VKVEQRISRVGSDVRGPVFSRRVLSWPFIFAIRVYQATLGPLMGGQCRFQPTCSVYAIEAYKVHGPARGSWLTAKRLARCHPLCRGGFDPVPELKKRLDESGRAVQ
jgi:uncharacterized protein